MNTSPPTVASENFSGPVIVLHRPQIPQNTGNISRLCVAINSPLIVTGRAGFSFDAAAVRRAGLDHWQHLDFTHYPRFAEFARIHRARRMVAVSKTGQASALGFDWQKGDILLFGNETLGLPPALLKRTGASVYLPMSGAVRSLNLSNSVAVVAYEYIRTVYGAAAMHQPQQYPRTGYRKIRHV